MPTCNLSEIIHNIWLQQFGKNVECFFVATSDDYVRVFKQSASNKVYLNGGKCRKGLSSTKTHIGFFNWLKQLLSFFTIIVTM
jgi:hypothetical protein